MGNQKYEIEKHSVDTILSWIKTKEVVIPEIQRPFVWKAVQVRNLIDSLYNGYPVGYLIVSRSHDLKLKDGTISKGQRILIDGQQRVTALTAAILGRTVLNKEYQERPIRIAYNPFAQEEAKSVSENQKWRIRKDFEQGLIWGGGISYGYRVVDKKLVLVPDEAKVVRKIFDLYLNGLGFQLIARKLNEEGISPMFAKKWNKATIQQIVANINYTGDLLLQKTYRENYLTKKTLKNNGELDQFFIEDDHEPIISKETYYEALELRRKRVEFFKLDNYKVTRYPLSGFVKCGICGKGYSHKKTRYREKWSCNTFQNEGKNACSSKSIPDSELTRIVLEVLGIDELKVEKIKRKLICIEVFPDNRLIFHLKGEIDVERKWNDISRKDSWTDEMKEEARRKAKDIYRKEQ